MRDIFISYRRKDGDPPAFVLLVREHLKSKFGADNVFFDQVTIPPGASFPGHIRDGIREAKVILVLITPNWVREKGGDANRLEQPGDFVRQEVELALETHALECVIPILERKQDLPPETDFPDGIKPLRSENNAMFFEGGALGTDLHFTRLDERLDLLVSGVAAAEPSRLPHLCDREPQWNEVANRLKEQSLPVACAPAVLVLPGRENETHDAFVSRLEFDSIREWYRLNGWRGQAKFVRVWQAAAADNFDEFAPWFRQLLSREVAQTARVATDTELLEAIRKSATRLVVVVLWTHANEGEEAVRLARLVADYWRQFPVPPPELGLLTLVCFRFGAPARGWLGPFSSQARAEKNLRAELDKLAAELGTGPRLRFKLLPQLASPVLQHLNHWVEHPKVREALKHRTVRADRLRQVLNHQDALPMDDVIIGLEQLLDEFAKPVKR